MIQTMQTDIYGRCPVSLETTQEPNGSWLVRKSKDLNQCKLRQGFDFAIKTNTFQTDGVSNYYPIKIIFDRNIYYSYLFCNVKNNFDFAVLSNKSICRCKLTICTES